jgi:adenosylmethionine-8-amino-7-oxononanoate aminotransferase
MYTTIADGIAAGLPLGHGYTYSGHPVSAAIALEVLKIYHDGGLLANGAAQAPRFAAGLDSMLGHPLVGDARHRGLLGAIELVADKRTKRPFDPALRLSERVTRAALRNGLIFRAFGDNILGFAPALCYSAAEFELLFERLTRVLDEVLGEIEVKQAVG